MSDYLIKAGVQGPTSLIDKSFASAVAYQTYLEAIRNVEQALERDKQGEGRYWGPFLRGERPEARFVVDVRQIENGAVKMLLWNTAPPMSEEEMRRYFTTVGTSHEQAVQYSSSRRDGQYGQGFRQGTLPWNRFGMVAISVDPRTGGVAGAKMMWMHKVPLSDGGPEVYAIKPLSAYIDASGQYVEDIVVPVCTLYGIDFAAVIPTEVAEYGGMVFVMLGNDLTEHTFDGARVKKENGAGIYKFLNDATLDGTIATVTFATPDSGAGGGKRIDIEGQTVRFDRRRVRAYSEWATDRVRADGSPAVIAEGELTNPETGVVYRWIAGPLDLKESRHDVWNGKGFIVAPYKTDVHPVLPSVTRADRGYAFGMLAKTATVVGLQVVMPVRTTDEQEGLFVEQTLERSRLILNTGEDVPWREVGRWFAENLPEPIAALNAEVEATTQRKSFDLRQFKARMTGYLSGLGKATANIEAPDGDEPGDPIRGQGGSNDGGEAGGGSGSRSGQRRRQELDRNPDGARLGKLRVQAGLPDVKWLTGAQWDEQVGEDRIYAATFRQGVNPVLFANSDHHLFKHVIEAIITELQDETGLLPDVTYPRDYLVERVQHHMTCNLLGMIGHIGKVNADAPEVREQMLTPATLTACAAGFNSVVELVKTEIKGSRRLRAVG